MSEFVREHSLELIERQDLQQREPEDEVIFLPAEEAEPRDLHDGGVEVIRQQHLVGRRGVGRASNPFDGREQLRVLARPAGAPSAPEFYPQRFKNHPHEHDEWDHEFEQDRRLSGDYRAGDGRCRRR